MATPASKRGGARVKGKGGRGRAFGSVLLLALTLGYIRWPLLLLVPVWISLLSTRIVWLNLKSKSQ